MKFNTQFIKLAYEFLYRLYSFTPCFSQIQIKIAILEILYVKNTDQR